MVGLNKITFFVSKDRNMTYLCNPYSSRKRKVVCGFTVDCICSAAGELREGEEGIVKLLLLAARSWPCANIANIANIATICSIQTPFAPTPSSHLAFTLLYICLNICIGLSISSQSSLAFLEVRTRKGTEGGLAISHFCFHLWDYSCDLSTH